MQDIVNAFGARPALKVNEISFMRHIMLRDVLDTTQDISIINRSRNLFIRHLLGELRNGVLNSGNAVSRCGITQFTDKEWSDWLSKKTFADNDAETFAESFALFSSVMCGRIRIDCHQEYLTITLICDCSRADFRRYAEDLSANLGLEVGILDYVINIRHEMLYALFWSRIDSLLRIDFSSKNPASDKPGTYSTSLGDMVENCWNSSFSDANPRINLENEKYRENKKIKKVSENILEFRGFCLFREELNNELVSSSPLPHRERARQIGIGLKKYVARNRQFFHSFLNVKTSESIDVARFDRNAILCEMLHGVAVYASSLGNPRHLEYGNSSDHAMITRVAVNYFLVYGGHSSERAGRLIRLLHVLGEMRHAALFDHLELKEASIRMRQLGQLWHPGDNDVRKYKKDKEKINSYYRYVINKKLFTSIGKLGSEDLSYRLQRSRFYSDTFRSRVGDLHCESIPPYQSYDAFMRRNVYPYFDKYSSLQHRFQSSQSAMQYLESQNQAHKADRFNKIVGQFSSIAILFGMLGIFQFLLGNEIASLILSAIGITKEIYQNVLISMYFFCVSAIVILCLIFGYRFVTGLVKIRQVENDATKKADLPLKYDNNESGSNN